MSGLLAANDVTLHYDTPAGTVDALRGVSIELQPGEMVSLFGASGSGKSSLISVLAGLERPSSGQVLLEGTSLGDASERVRLETRLRRIGLVFQDNNLITQFTASENIQLVLRAQGHAGPAEEARRLLDLVGIGELADRSPLQMSGGQRQRVGIARALAGGRPILLCDEPTGALDHDNSVALFARLRTLADDHGTSVLVASHDALAKEAATRTLTMVDGRLVP